MKNHLLYSPDEYDLKEILNIMMEASIFSLRYAKFSLNKMCNKNKFAKYYKENCLYKHPKRKVLIEKFLYKISQETWI